MGRGAERATHGEAYHMTDVKMEPATTMATVQSTTTDAAVAAIGICTTYYWLHPGQCVPVHQEVIASGGDD